MSETATVGRPSDYGPEIANTICERLADGESLREICRDDAMPAKSTIMIWLGLHEEFADQYARAREAQADHIFDEILDISDDATNDWMTRRQGEEIITVADHEHIARSKLRVDSRKWMAGKLAPKKYGEKQLIEATGKDGSDLIPPQTEDRQVARAILALLATGAKDE